MTPSRVGGVVTGTDVYVPPPCAHPKAGSASAVSSAKTLTIGVAERHRGDVLKFRGDALLLFFSGDGHERRACLAASDMQWLIGETGKMMSSVGSVTLRMSTGIVSGACHFFLVDGTHRELLV